MSEKECPCMQYIITFYCKRPRADFSKKIPLKYLKKF